jgi:sulfur carrier protein
MRSWGALGMAVRARLIPEGRVIEVNVKGRIKVRSLLEKLGLNTEAAVVLKSGRPLTEDEELEDGDYVDVVRVLSGG